MVRHASVFHQCLQSFAGYSVRCLASAAYSQHVALERLVEVCAPPTILDLMMAHHCTETGCQTCWTYRLPKRAVAGRMPPSQLAHRGATIDHAFLEPCARNQVSQSSPRRLLGVPPERSCRDGSTVQEGATQTSKGRRKRRTGKAALRALLLYRRTLLQSLNCPGPGRRPSFCQSQELA